jgi:lipopolysaccharide/colanic/teichoic acid biosynthesis glycosyltransferase
MTIFQAFVKRSFDCIAAAAGLVVLLPLITAIGIIVKISSPGTVFFVQKRVGRNGTLFSTIKFRTMRTGAEKYGSVTTAHDVRVTVIGRVLRRFKLDELPQLWNVLIGRMSFVGPRPDVPGYADRLTGEERKILDLRPGITGPATLYFRNEEELLSAADDPKRFNDETIWPVKVRMNLLYLEQYGFWKDIGYIFITLIPALNRYLKLVPESPKNTEDIKV